ncbi:MAG: signal recognition particle-docking protein FtsY [Clostridium sp.]|nr:signal recognition particle-docking protein FtsY [Clostridium sp.]
MGLINWLKQKIFHKKDEAKKEEKPVEPVVEENLKSEEAKDKTSGESVVEKTLEGNKVDEEPVHEVKKEEIKEESLQPEVVKEEQSVEQSIEDKVETKEEPIVEENTLEESVQPEVKEEQKIEEQPVEENKVEDNSSIKDEEKYEPSKENKQSSFEEPVIEENTLEEPVQPEVKEEQKIEEQPVEENKVEDNSSIKDEEKCEPSKENKQSSFEEPVIQNNTDGIENNNEFEYSNPLLDLVLEDKLEKKESKVEVNDEQPIEDKAETKEEPVVEGNTLEEPVQPEVKEEQKIEEQPVEENKVEEKENEEDEDEVIEEKEEQTKEAEQVNSTDEPVIEKKNDEAIAKKVEVDHETKIYNLGLAKSREGFGARLNSIANKYKEANSDYFDELERCLIEADVGVNLTMSVLDETEKMAASQHLDNPKEINDLLVDNLFMNYAKSGDSFQTEIKFDPENPTVLLMVGVNGTGKTTTIAKLAKHYKELGKKVLLVAADTFRAGAVQQLSIWANRIGVDIFERGQGADPASVCFDAIKKAINEKYDLVMVDTAGRLHTKDYLMAELGKVNRVIKKVLPVAPQEIWLALDANTGQNGVQQAKVFKEVTPLTGVVITKMDGTSKGGIILAIRDQLGVPVRFIGLGEHEDDLREFDLDRYLYALLVGEDENFEE